MNSLSLPEELGTIHEKYFPQGEVLSRLVIYLQNAHSNIDSETNTQRIIQYLEKEYGLSLVLLEGGEGRLDSLFFKSFPDRERKEKLLEDYLKQGDLSGAEVSSILEEGNNTLYYGIETQSLYNDNKEAFLKAIQNGSQISTLLAGRKSDLDKRAKRTLSPESLIFQTQSEAFKAEQLDLVKYLKSLRTLYGSNFAAQYPELNKILTAESNELALTRESYSLAMNQVISAFKTKVVPSLSKKEKMETNDLIQSYQTSRLDPGTLIQKIVQISGQTGFHFKLPEALDPSLAHARMLSSIKGTKVFDELEALANELRQTLPRTEEERELLNDYHQLALLSNFSKLELLPKDWEMLKASDKMEPELKPLFAPHFTFYALAEKRNDTLAENTLKLMNQHKTKVALLSTGGFHTGGITQRLKEKNIPFILISPKINTITGKEIYLNAMEGKRSFMKYFNGSLWEALAKDYAAKLTATLRKEELAPELKQWRDSIIQNSIAEGRITQATQYTKYVDALGDGSNGLIGTTPDLKALVHEKLSFFSKGLKNLYQKQELNPKNLEILITQMNQVGRSQLALDLVMAGGPRGRQAFIQSPDRIKEPSKRSEVRGDEPSKILDELNYTLDFRRTEPTFLDLVKGVFSGPDEIQEGSHRTLYFNDKSYPLPDLVQLYNPKGKSEKDKTWGSAQVSKKQFLKFIQTAVLRLNEFRKFREAEFRLTSEFRQFKEDEFRLTDEVEISLRYDPKLVHVVINGKYLYTILREDASSVYLFGKEKIFHDELKAVLAIAELPLFLDPILRSAVTKLLPFQYFLYLPSELSARSEVRGNDPGQLSESALIALNAIRDVIQSAEPPVKQADNLRALIMALLIEKNIANTGAPPAPGAVPWKKIENILRAAENLMTAMRESRRTQKQIRADAKGLSTRIGLFLDEYEKTQETKSGAKPHRLVQPYETLAKQYAQGLDKNIKAERHRNSIARSLVATEARAGKKNKITLDAVNRFIKITIADWNYLADHNFSEFRRSVQAIEEKQARSNQYMDQYDVGTLALWLTMSGKDIDGDRIWYDFDRIPRTIQILTVHDVRKKFGFRLSSYPKSRSEARGDEEEGFEEFQEDAEEVSKFMGEILKRLDRAAYKDDSLVEQRFGEIMKQELTGFYMKQDLSFEDFSPFAAEFLINARGRIKNADTLLTSFLKKESDKLRDREIIKNLKEAIIITANVRLDISHLEIAKENLGTMSILLKWIDVLLSALIDTKEHRKISVDLEKFRQDLGEVDIDPIRQWPAELNRWSNKYEDLIDFLKKSVIKNLNTQKKYFDALVPGKLDEKRKKEIEFEFETIRGNYIQTRDQILNFIEQAGNRVFALSGMGRFLKAIGVSDEKVKEIEISVRKLKRINRGLARVYGQMQVEFTALQGAFNHATGRKSEKRIFPDSPLWEFFPAGKINPDLKNDLENFSRLSKTKLSRIDKGLSFEGPEFLNQFLKAVAKGNFSSENGKAVQDLERFAHFLRVYESSFLIFFSDQAMLSPHFHEFFKITTRSEARLPIDSAISRANQGVRESSIVSQSRAEARETDLRVQDLLNQRTKNKTEWIELLHLLGNNLPEDTERTAVNLAERSGNKLSAQDIRSALDRHGISYEDAKMVRERKEGRTGEEWAQTIKSLVRKAARINKEPTASNLADLSDGKHTAKEIRIAMIQHGLSYEKLNVVKVKPGSGKFGKARSEARKEEEVQTLRILRERIKTLSEGLEEEIQDWQLKSLIDFKLGLDVGTVKMTLQSFPATRNYMASADALRDLLLEFVSRSVPSDMHPDEKMIKHAFGKRSYVRARQRKIDVFFERYVKTYHMKWGSGFLIETPITFWKRLTQAVYRNLFRYDVSQTSMDYSIEQFLFSIGFDFVAGGPVRAGLLNALSAFRRYPFRSYQIDVKSPRAQHLIVQMNRTLKEASLERRRALFKGYQKRKGYLWIEHAMEEFLNMPHKSEMGSTVSRVSVRELLVQTLGGYFRELMRWKGGRIEDAIDRKILRFLIDRLMDPDPWVIKAAVRGIGSVADRIDEMSKQNILDRYYDILNGDNDSVAEGSVARGLREVFSPQSLGRLIEALIREKSEWVQTYMVEALEFLVHRYDPEAVRNRYGDQLLSLLLSRAEGAEAEKRSYIMLRVGSIKALARLGWYDKRITDLLEHILLDDPDPTVQEAAMWALARIYVSFPEAMIEIDRFLEVLLAYRNGEHKGRHNVLLGEGYASELLNWLVRFSPNSNLAEIIKKMPRPKQKIDSQETNPVIFIDINSLLPTEGTDVHKGSESDRVFDLLKEFSNLGWSSLITDRYRQSRDSVISQDFSSMNMPVQTDLMRDAIEKLAGNQPIRIPSRDVQRGKRPNRMSGVLVPVAGKPVVILGRGSELWFLKQITGYSSNPILSTADFSEAHSGKFHKLIRTINQTLHRSEARLLNKSATSNNDQGAQVSSIVFQSRAEARDKIDQAGLFSWLDQLIAQAYELRGEPVSMDRPGEMLSESFSAEHVLSGRKLYGIGEIHGSRRSFDFAVSLFKQHLTEMASQPDQWVFFIEGESRLRDALRLRNNIPFNTGQLAMVIADRLGITTEDPISSLESWRVVEKIFEKAVAFSMSPQQVLGGIIFDLARKSSGISLEKLIETTASQWIGEGHVTFDALLDHIEAFARLSYRLDWSGKLNNIVREVVGHASEEDIDRFEAVLAKHKGAKFYITIAGRAHKDQVIKAFQAANDRIARSEARHVSPSRQINHLWFSLRKGDVHQAKGAAMDLKKTSVGGSGRLFFVRGPKYAGHEEIWSHDVGEKQVWQAALQILEPVKDLIPANQYEGLGTGIIELIPALWPKMEYGVILSHSIVNPDTKQPGIEILFLDHSDGLPDLQDATYSYHAPTGQAKTTKWQARGSFGENLELVKRFSDELSIESRKGQGTKITVRVWAKDKPAALRSEARLIDQLKQVVDLVIEHWMGLTLIAIGATVTAYVAGEIIRRAHEKDGSRYLPPSKLVKVGKIIEKDVPAQVVRGITLTFLGYSEESEKFELIIKAPGLNIFPAAKFPLEVERQERGHPFLQSLKPPKRMMKKVMFEKLPRDRGEIVVGNSIFVEENYLISIFEVEETKLRIEITPPRRSEARGKPTLYPGDESFKARLEKHKANLRAIAKELHVSRMTISNWIRDHGFSERAEDLRPHYPGDESFKALLEKHKANQQAIADELHVNQKTISNWIRDHGFSELAEKLRASRSEARVTEDLVYEMATSPYQVDTSAFDSRSFRLKAGQTFVINDRVKVKVDSIQLNDIQMSFEAPEDLYIDTGSPRIPKGSHRADNIGHFVSKHHAGDVIQIGNNIVLELEDVHDSREKVKTRGIQDVYKLQIRISVRSEARDAVYRQMVFGDWDQIVALDKRLYEQKAWNKDKWFRADTVKNIELFVSEVESRIVGFVAVQLKSRGAKSRRGTIKILKSAVLDEYQGQGIERSLLKQVVDYLEETNVLGRYHRIIARVSDYDKTSIRFLRAAQLESKLLRNYYGYDQAKMGSSDAVEFTSGISSFRSEAREDVTEATEKEIEAILLKAFGKEKLTGKDRPKINRIYGMIKDHKHRNQLLPKEKFGNHIRSVLGDPDRASRFIELLLTEFEFKEKPRESVFLDPNDPSFDVLAWHERRYFPSLQALERHLQKKGVEWRLVYDWIDQVIRPLAPHFDSKLSIDPNAEISSENEQLLQNLASEIIEQVFIPHGIISQSSAFQPGEMAVGRIIKKEMITTPAGRNIELLTVQPTKKGAFGEAVALQNRIIFGADTLDMVRETTEGVKKIEQAMDEGKFTIPPFWPDPAIHMITWIQINSIRGRNVEEIVEINRQQTLAEELSHSDAESYFQELTGRPYRSGRDRSFIVLFLSQPGVLERLSQRLLEEIGAVFETEGKLNAIRRGPLPIIAFEELLQAVLPKTPEEELQRRLVEPEHYSGAYALTLYLLGQELFQEEITDPNRWLHYLSQHPDYKTFENSIREAANAAYPKFFIDQEERSNILSKIRRLAEEIMIQLPPQLRTDLTQEEITIWFTIGRLGFPDRLRRTIAHFVSEHPNFQNYADALFQMVTAASRSEAREIEKKNQPTFFSTAERRLSKTGKVERTTSFKEMTSRSTAVSRSFTSAISSRKGSTTSETDRNSLLKSSINVATSRAENLSSIGVVKIPHSEDIVNIENNQNNIVLSAYDRNRLLSIFSLAQVVNGVGTDGVALLDALGALKPPLAVRIIHRHLDEELKQAEIEGLTPVVSFTQVNVDEANDLYGAIIKAINQPTLVEYHLTEEEIGKMKNPVLTINQLLKTAKGAAEKEAFIVPVLYIPPQFLRDIKLDGNKNDPVRTVPEQGKVSFVNKELKDSINIAPAIIVTVKPSQSSTKNFASDHYADDNHFIHYDNPDMAAQIFMGALIELSGQEAKWLLAHEGNIARARNEAGLNSMTLVLLAEMFKTSLSQKLTARAA